MCFSKAPLGDIKVRGHLSQAAIRPGYCYRLDSGLCSQPVAPFRKCVDNVLAGLKERICFLDESGTVPPPCHRHHEECQKEIDLVARAIDRPSPMKLAAYVATRPGRTRKLYEKALERFNAGPVSLREEARTSLFIKWEKTVHSKRQVPRVINPRSPLYNILLGRYLHNVEKPIFDALRHAIGQEDPVIAKGMTMEEKGALIAKHFSEGYVGVGLDASRFDQSIGKELLRLEHSLYSRLYPDRLLKELLSLQLDNYGKCRFDDGVSIELRYGAIRCSGDVNTSLGNCIISVVLASRFLKENGLDRHARLLCDGDDLIMFVKRQFLNQFLSFDLTGWYRNWGLRMKVESPALIPEQQEFCQAKPVWTPRGYVLVRNPVKALNCDYVGFADCARDKYYRVLLRSVGLCGLSMAAGMPVLQEWYAFGVRNGNTGKLSGQEKYSSGMFYQARLQRAAGAKCTPIPVHPETRCSFELAFGIDVPTQLAIEDYIVGSKFCGHVEFLQEFEQIYQPEEQFSQLKPQVIQL